MPGSVLNVLRNSPSQNPYKSQPSFSVDKNIDITIPGMPYFIPLNLKGDQFTLFLPGAAPTLGFPLDFPRLRLALAGRMRLYLL